jgi:hypothetical protein
VLVGWAARTLIVCRTKAAIRRIVEQFRGSAGVFIIMEKSLSTGTRQAKPVKQTRCRWSVI